jgi:hypothetical protein
VIAMSQPGGTQPEIAEIVSLAYALDRDERRTASEWTSRKSRHLGDFFCAFCAVSRHFVSALAPCDTIDCTAVSIAFIT